MLPAEWNNVCHTQGEDAWGCILLYWCSATVSCSTCSLLIRYSKMCHTPDEHRLDAHLPSLGYEPVDGSQWHMTTVMPDLWLPLQPQGITIQMMHDSECSFKQHFQLRLKLQCCMVTWLCNIAMSHSRPPTRSSFDNDERHVTAFQPISEAAHSWSYDNTHWLVPNCTAWWLRHMLETQAGDLLSHMSNALMITPLGHYSWCLPEMTLCRFDCGLAVKVHVVQSAR